MKLTSAVGVRSRDPASLGVSVGVRVSSKEAPFETLPLLTLLPVGVLLCPLEEEEEETALASSLSFPEMDEL